MRKTSTWEIIKRNLENLSILEITDSKLHKVNSQDLFLYFLARLSAKDKYYSVSQFFSPSQSKYDQYDQRLKELRESNPINLAITSGFGTTELTKSYGEDHVIHVHSRNLEDPLATIVHFSGATLSNIIYASQEEYDGWLQKITGWNRVFLDIFWLKININSLIDFESQTGLLLWTADGHINLIAKDLAELDRYLGLLEEVAEHFSQSLDLRFESI